MIGRTNTGGGGGGLNFKVVRYDPGAELPASAAENTIAVFTNVDIPWWYFTPEQPENMKQGEVWFKTALSSNVAFNALKKNNIEVSPSSAQQYVDGKLNALDAYISIDNAWVQFSYKRFYLYNAGDECTDVTGGWVGVAAGTSDKRYVPEISKYATTMRTRINQNQSERLGNNATGSCKPANNIDLTNFTTITFVVTESKNPMGNNLVGVTTDLTSGKIPFTASAKAAVGTQTIDISNISGECRVMIMPWANDPDYVNLVDAYITVSQVYLE